MSENLDTLIAQAVYKARLIERAVHDDGPWFIEWGGLKQPAARLIESTGVSFTAIFPEAYHDPRATLYCGDDPVSFLNVAIDAHEVRPDVPFEMCWMLTVDQPDTTFALD